MQSSTPYIFPVANGDTNEKIPAHITAQLPYHPASVGQETQNFMKCIGLWRTIILSSLGMTMYPYSQYMRALSLRDLEDLFTDPKFGPGISRSAG